MLPNDLYYNDKYKLRVFLLAKDDETIIFAKPIDILHAWYNMQLLQKLTLIGGIESNKSRYIISKNGWNSSISYNSYGVLGFWGFGVLGVLDYSRMRNAKLRMWNWKACYQWVSTIPSDRSKLRLAISCLTAILAVRGGWAMRFRRRLDPDGCGRQAGSLPDRWSTGL